MTGEPSINPVVTIAVTGGAGYVGALAATELRKGGHEVRALDVLLHGQRNVAEALERDGVELIRGDVRDPVARKRLLGGCDTVVHLAAIVGDPACAADPKKSHEVNVEGALSLVRDAAAAGVGRFIFASTCSNYGRMTDPTMPIDETGELAPVSLYAEQKVAVERHLLEADPGLEAVCLRFATVYGAAPRMRFDLTVNEFTRELTLDRELVVFGEQFWRPYVHVRDAARAACVVLESAPDAIRGEVFNVGDTAENYRKVDIVELLRERLPGASVSFVHRDEDPRDYRVGFDKVRERLGFAPERTVADGIDEVMSLVRSGLLGDPYAAVYSN
jgi:nucleoside-diphosphate-sugar epimerase